MANSQNRVVKMAEAIIKARWYVIIAVLVLVALMASGGKNIGFDTNYRVFFGPDNPQLKAFDELQKVYTKTDNITFVIKAKEGDIFNRRVIAAIKEITELSWQLPYSTRVDSLSNYQYSYAEGDNLTVVDLIESEAEDLSDFDLMKIKSVAFAEPLLVDNVISKSGQATGVNVIFTFPEKTMFEMPEANSKAMELLAEVQAKYPEVEIRASGMVSLNNAFSESSQKDMQTLIPLMYLVLLITMVIFLRSFSAMLATLVVIAISAISAIGLAGHFGINLTPPSATAPTIILTLAIADSIHIIVSMFKAMQHGMNKRQAIAEAMRINFQPVFLTSLTTAIGFLTLNFSDSPPFHDLGNITAAGVILAFLFSIILLPALLAVLPIKYRKNEANNPDKDFMHRLSEFVINKRKALVIIMSSVVVVLALMIPKLKVDDQWLEYFDYSIPFRGDSEFVIENLTGIYRIEYSIPGNGVGGVTEPLYLAKLDEFSDWLRARDEVTHVYSIIDIMKRLNKNMHGDDQDWYKIPDSKELAAQYLLLYEFSLPYGLDLTDRINIDKSATRLTVTLDGDMSTSAIRNFKDASENWLKANAPEYMQSEATSPPVMFAYIAERNINSMMEGNIIALFLISFVIMLALKNIRLGLVSLVPNLVPPIMGFGLWALFIGEVNMAVAFVTSICLGIIVDDTVHFLSKYNRARKEKGLNPEDAVSYAFSTVGTALFITSFILVFGFAVLMLSAFKMNSLMGTLTSLIIAIALVADCLLLPPLLIYMDKLKKGK